MIRIFLADDHPIVRQGVRRMLDEQPDMTVVGEASDGWQVLNAEGRASWDVLVLDLSLPRLGGMEVLRRLRVELPGLRVLVLSMYAEEQYAGRLLAEQRPEVADAGGAPLGEQRLERAVILEPERNRRQVEHGLLQILDRRRKCIGRHQAVLRIHGDETLRRKLPADMRHLVA